MIKSEEDDTQDDVSSRRQRRVLTMSSESNLSKTSVTKDNKNKKTFNIITSKKKQAPKKKSVKALNKTQIKEELNNENKDDVADFSSSSDEDAADDENTNMTAIEIQRQKNIEERMKFFHDLKIDEAKQELKEVSKKKLYRPPKVLISEPKRTSLRLQGVEATSTTRSPFHYIPVTSRNASALGQRDVPYEVKSTLPMSELIVSTNFTAEDCDKFISNCSTCIQETKISEENFFKHLSIQEFKSKFETLDQHEVKVTSKTTCSMSFHPKYNGILLAVSSLSGIVSIWNADLNSGDSDSQIINFKPHVKPAKCVSFSKHESQILYSSSYDGTVCRGDLQHQNFTMVYSSPQDEQVYWHNEIGPSVVLIAQGGGSVIKMDVREPNWRSESYKCHDRAINTIDAHPIKEHNFVTASNREVSIWDLRKMNNNYSKCSAQISTLSCQEMPVGAFFSPITGDKLLITSNCDNISIFSCHNLAFPMLTSKDYKNQPWVENYKAMWHPQREDIFIKRSTNSQPHRLEIYEASEHECNVLCEIESDEKMTTFGVVTIFHPSLPYIACSNSRSYVHLLARRETY